MFKNILKLFIFALFALSAGTPALSKQSSFFLKTAFFWNKKTTDSAKLKAPKSFDKKKETLINQKSAGEDSESLRFLSQDPLNKEYFLGEDYYKPKAETLEMRKRLQADLEMLTDICGLAKGRAAKLKLKIKKIKSLLERITADPYIDYMDSLALADMSDLIEKTIENENSLAAADYFASAVRFHYNLPAETQPKEFYFTWAKDIHKALQCAGRKAAAENI